MKAEELMVGDWVYAIDANGEKHPCRANNLEYDYTNKRGDFCVDFYGTGYEAEWPDVAFNVEPIPITPEILEKNGFSQDPLNGHIFIFHEKSGEVIYYEYGPKYGLTIDNQLATIQDLKIKYIHELQNALRLCGIDKTIEL